MFINEGIEHLIEKVKKTLDIPNLKLLKHLDNEDFEEVLSNVKSRLEKRALLKVFKMLISVHEEQVDDEFEKEIQKLVIEAGLDEKHWVPKVRELFRNESLGFAQVPNRENLEGFLKYVKNPAQNLALRVVLSKFTGIDVTEMNIGRQETELSTEASSAQFIPLMKGTNIQEGAHLEDAHEVFKSVQRGLLSRGVYFSKNLEKLSKERDHVIDAKGNLNFKAVSQIPTVIHHEFSSKMVWETFERNIDKHMQTRSISVGKNIWGINISETFSDRESETFASSIHYQMVPVRCLYLTSSSMELRPEVISSLQAVESSLKRDNYEPREHFKNFFYKYGSHVNNGVIEFGGMVKSTAYCQGFQEKDRSNVSAVVSEASQAALFLSFSDDVRTEISLNAYEVLSRTSQMCAEDLQNISVTVKKIGGPQQATDQDTWEGKLSADKKSWVITSRNTPPLPIWNLLQKYDTHFDNVERMRDAMMHEWREEISSEDVHIPSVSAEEELDNKDSSPSERHKIKENQNLERKPQISQSECTITPVHKNNKIIAQVEREDKERNRQLEKAVEVQMSKEDDESGTIPMEEGLSHAEEQTEINEKTEPLTEKEDRAITTEEKMSTAEGPAEVDDKTDPLVKKEESIISVEEWVFPIEKQKAMDVKTNPLEGNGNKTILTDKEMEKVKRLSQADELMEIINKTDSLKEKKDRKILAKEETSPIEEHLEMDNRPDPIREREVRITTKDDTIGEVDNTSVEKQEIEMSNKGDSFEENDKARIPTAQMISLGKGHIELSHKTDALTLNGDMTNPTDKRMETAESISQAEEQIGVDDKTDSFKGNKDNIILAEERIALVEEKTEIDDNTEPLDENNDTVSPTEERIYPTEEHMKIYDKKDPPEEKVNRESFVGEQIEEVESMSSEDKKEGINDNKTGQLKKNTNGTIITEERIVEIDTLSQEDEQVLKDREKVQNCTKTPLQNCENRNTLIEEKTKDQTLFLSTDKTELGASEEENLTPFGTPPENIENTLEGRLGAFFLEHKLKMKTNTPPMEQKMQRDSEILSPDIKIHSHDQRIKERHMKIDEEPVTNSKEQMEEYLKSVEKELEGGQLTFQTGQTIQQESSETSPTRDKKPESLPQEKDLTLCTSQNKQSKPSEGNISEVEKPISRTSRSNEERDRLEEDFGKSEIEEKRLQNMEEQKNIMLLRLDVQIWLEKGLNREEVRFHIQDLVQLKRKYESIGKQWVHDVIYLWDVQKVLVWAAKEIKQKNTNKRNQQEMVAAVKDILQPLNCIQASNFLCLREVLNCIAEKEENYDPFKMETLMILPTRIKKSMEKEGLQEDTLKETQHRLESTMRDYSAKKMSFEYLVCLGVLQLFSFNLQTFTFEYYLSEEDLRSICKVLKEAFLICRKIASNKGKQAYVINLALHGMQHKLATVQYMMDNMPGGTCPELSLAFKFCRSGGRYNFKPVQMAVHNLLGEEQKSPDLGALMCSLTSQFHFLNSHKVERINELDSPEHSFDGIAKKLIEALHMKQYYPQKLKYEDVIKLTPEVNSDINKKPNSLQELPWYFMRHIIGIDSDTRESCHLFKDNDSLSDSESEEEDNDTIQSVHPLDLIYVIFLCADDFLRQELAEKMSRCQYAVPFILPEVESSGKPPSNLILHWALQNISRNYYQNKKVVNMSMLNVEAPLVTCLSVGKETSWKCRLLNKMLSPQQDTFWHQGLKGGQCKQRVSQGMVEVAWYLPGTNEDNKFQYPVTFANVRETTTHSQDLYQRLHNSSSVTCLFTDDISEEVLTFLNSTNEPNKVIVVLLHDRKEDKRLKQQSMRLLKFLEKHQVIRKVAEDVNFIRVHEQLKKSIEHVIKTQTQTASLSNFVMGAKKDIYINVDDRNCYHGYMAAQSILHEIDDHNTQCSGSAKAEVLPCQSDIESRREMAALEKELCRQNKRDEDTTIPQHALSQRRSKWKLQLKQIQNHISETFKYFVFCLLTFDSQSRKYFLQSLKLGLDKRSIDLLQPLYDEYDQCRTEEESPERDNKLRSIDEQLTHGSLGIEHFFREMAVMYENMIAIKTQQKEAPCNNLDKVMDQLAEIMASLFVEGTAIEIMDGDVVYVPVAWLQAVFNKMLTTSTLFKVSVLGAQSSGKSTLLNTAFGLNFPVSSGRCTRGAYMQLIKISSTMKKIINCDYIAVIDSEGLMSRKKLEKSDYDNELATFIIGLSDLTLVNIKGEGTEMHDVLPLAIHVFLHMNIVGEHQACHFIHQNMGAMDVMTKLATEIDAFVRDLNMKTYAAAKDAGQSDDYTKFTDVLRYDPRKDNTYLPGLWNGELPMAKTNALYSKRLQILKQSITKHVEVAQAKKQMASVQDFTKRLEELWEAIKYENFILSFKNVLAVEAHKNLSKIFAEEQWDVKRKMRIMINEEKNSIKNEILVGDRHRTVRQVVQDSRLRLTNCLQEITAGLHTRILHYFKCNGCKECDEEVRNRHLLANNEKEFKDEVTNLESTMVREIALELESLEIKMTTEQGIQKLSSEMNIILRTKVHDALKNRQENLTDDAIEKMFDDLWTDATRDILANSTSHIEKNPNIEATIQTTIATDLKDISFLYLQKFTGHHRQEGMHSKFTVDRAHHLKRKERGKMVKDQDVHRLQMKTNHIINEVSKHFTSNTPEGKQFNQRDVDLLLKDVDEQINSIRDERFRVTRDYMTDLVYHIQGQAIVGFNELHKRYVTAISPETLLKGKRKGFHDMFQIQMGHGDAAAKFCETILADIILKNIDEQLSVTELLDDLRLHCGEMFRDIRSIQASIMARLYRENDFDLYIFYAIFYETFIKMLLVKESKKYFSEGNRLKVLAQLKNEKLISSLKKAIDETVKSPSSDENFIKTFISKIDKLKISHNETAAYLDLKVPVEDQVEFGSIVCHQLENEIKNNICETIRSWKVGEKLDEKNLDDFLFTEIVGYKAKCPFCDVPCDAHTGGKTQGNHSATMHRPKGLGGWFQRETKRLSPENCCVCIASDSAAFVVSDGNEYRRHLYREYDKMYPDWTIIGNAKPEDEKYWKWVFAAHNSKWAKFYGANETENIPEEWLNYGTAEVKQELEANYNINIEISSLEQKPAAQSMLVDLYHADEDQLPSVLETGATLVHKLRNVFL